MTAGPAPPPPTPLFADPGDWVEGHFAPIYIRRTSGAVRWCAQWWRHPEAVVRFTALWRTWEAARLERSSSGMADWHIRYLDEMLPVLLSEHGPFAACKPDKHVTPTPTELAPVPADFWN